MATAHYLAVGRYSAAHGTRTYAFAPGEIVEVTVADIDGLVADSAPLDWSRVVSASEAQAAKAKREAEIAETQARQIQARRILAEHRDAWGASRCPGSPGASFTAGDRPHEEPGDPLDTEGRTGLIARWRPQDGHVGGGWWVVACTYHVAAWERSELLPPALPHRDDRVHPYRVARAYKSRCGDARRLAGHRHEAMRQLAQDDGRLTFGEGETVHLVRWLAEWVARDSPGTLIDLDADGDPVDAEHGPSTDDTEPTEPTVVSAESTRAQHRGRGDRLAQAGA